MERTAFVLDEDSGKDDFREVGVSESEKMVLVLDNKGGKNKKIIHKGNLSESENTALVLAGGGGKGAFQIGVWKALIENDIMNDIKVIVGTSVGALNAVLIALGDYELAERIWKNITPNDMLEINKDGNGIFSREGLLRILDSLPLERLAYCGKDVYVTVQEVNNPFNNFLPDTTHLKSEYINTVSYVCINDLEVWKIKQYLLATSAMSINRDNKTVVDIYPKVTIDGREYYDAGIHEFYNIPIECAVNLGCKKCYVIALDTHYNIRKVKVHNVIPGVFTIDTDMIYPNTRFEVIKPTIDIGGIFEGTMNFTNPKINFLIELGYIDALRILIKKVGNGVVKGNRIIYTAMVAMFSTMTALNPLVSFTLISSAQTMQTLDIYFDEVNIKILYLVANHITKAKDMEEFIRFNNEITKANHKTMGGKTWYCDLIHVGGYKIQQHRIGVRLNHYRILDSNDNCVAYTFSGKKLLESLEKYIEFKNRKK
ncbi:MAG: patatin-like phospholipase family protein [Oscillospiraceae bacterium]|nr:patatin-like phospholipase family protein [Oscillospiraceae bacterium]